MRDSKHRTNVERQKGFTLIELMVTLAVISIIATASVPKIQMWVSRNQGLKVMSQITADVSKARSIAKSIVKQQAAVVGGGYSFGSRPQIAMLFKDDSYYILQRDNMAMGSWSETADTVLKSHKLPGNIEIDTLNGASVSSGNVLVFTATGRIKKNDGTFVSPSKDVTYMDTCGSENSELKGTSLFMAVVKVKVSNGNTLWYRAEIGPAGDSFACVSTESSFAGSTSNIIDL